MNTTSTDQNESAPKRAYRSTLRTRQAAETRAAIVRAAGELFAEQGYAGTSLAQIGRRAGVSTESVAANGPKRGLLLAAFEATLGGQEGADHLTEGPDLQHMMSLPVDEMLDALASYIIDSQERSNGIWRAFGAAADSDSEVAEAYAALSLRRRADTLNGVRILRSRGVLRDDVDDEEATYTIALLNGMDPYQLLVREWGWTTDRLRAWWVRSVRELLLKPEFRTGA